MLANHLTTHVTISEVLLNLYMLANHSLTRGVYPWRGHIPSFEVSHSEVKSSWLVEEVGELSYYSLTRGEYFRWHPVFVIRCVSLRSRQCSVVYPSSGVWHSEAVLRRWWTWIRSEVVLLNFISKVVWFCCQGVSELELLIWYTFIAVHIYSFVMLYFI